MQSTDHYTVYEQAIQFVASSFSVFSKDDFKPEIVHSISTGMRLIDMGYEGDVVVAGILQEVFEESEVDEVVLRERFGDRATGIVLANTKNSELSGEEKIRDIIERCAAFGMDALIVKAADILDNYEYFSRIKDKENIDYDIKQAEVLFSVTDGDGSIVFEKLKTIMNK